MTSKPNAESGFVWSTHGFDLTGGRLAYLREDLIDDVVIKWHTRGTLAGSGGEERGKRAEEDGLLRDAHSQLRWRVAEGFGKGLGEGGGSRDR